MELSFSNEPDKIPGPRGPDQAGRGVGRQNKETTGACGCQRVLEQSRGRSSLGQGGYFEQMLHKAFQEGEAWVHGLEVFMPLIACCLTPHLPRAKCSSRC